MPKSSDKTKGAKKRKKTPNTSNTNTESEENESKPVAKKKAKRNNNILEGIEMSKELSAKIKQKRSIRSSRSKSTKNTEPRLCGNGKPMPSLAELEAMYMDSEEDENTANHTPMPIPDNKPDRSATPVLPPDINDESLKSPTVLKKITSQVIDLISKKIEEIEDTPPPPVVPPKKRKKPDEPYIVGCKERPQVPWAPKTNFLVGDIKYGVEEDGCNSDDDCCPKKRKKRGKKINLSKSIFNAKSDEIAERLTNEAERIERGSSPDSNDTVSYDFPGNSPSSNTFRSFSPLPSTSRDSETILKNDKLFNNSLKAETLPNESQSDIEIIEIPYEEIVIDDTLNNSSMNSNIPYNDNQDDCCIIETEYDERKNSVSTFKAESPKNDIYSSIDLTQFTDNEVYEIRDDDIESVIAENQMILEKHKKKNSIDSVTAVDCSSLLTNSVVEILNTGNVSNNDTNDNTSSLPNMNANDHNNPKIPSHSVEAEIQLVNQSTTASNSAQNTAGNEIQEVVTEFFNHQLDSNSESSRSISIVDLTNCQDTILTRLSSFITSIESTMEMFFRGRQRTSAPCNNNDVVVIDQVVAPTDTLSNQTTLVPDIPSNADNLLCPTLNTPVTPSPRKNKRNNRTTDTSATSVSSPRTDSQPRSGRSLGECPICMDTLDNKPIASTLCGHIFCMGCIKTAFRSNGKRCPTCRKVLRGAGFHQLFL